MKLSDFIAEHKRLVKILRSGTKKEQKKEATGQAKELKAMIEKHKRK
jgi:hypothetical protein